MTGKVISLASARSARGRALQEQAESLKRRLAAMRATFEREQAAAAAERAAACQHCADPDCCCRRPRLPAGLLLAPILRDLPDLR
jgi:hypothetical protein